MRKTIILVLIAVALGAYVYFYEIKGGEEREKEKEIAEKLFNFEKDSVNYIRIKSPKGNFVFNKTMDGWQIEEPVQTRADDSPINSLLNSLSTSKKVRTISINPDEKNQFGLGVRAIQLNFKDKAGHENQVAIGDETNIGSNVYVSLTDSAAHLVPKGLKNNADKSLFDWRDKKAVHFEKNNIREFTLTNPKGRFTFIKEGAEWKIVKPIETKAEKSTVDAVLNKLESGRIKSVVDEEGKNLSKYNLSRPAYSIEMLSGAEKARTSIALSKVKDNTAYGKDGVRAHIFTVDSNFVGPFDKNLFGFRDKKIIDFDNNRVTRINLSHNNEPMRFYKDTSDVWYLDSGEKAKKWKINSLLSTIKNLKAEKFVDEDPHYFMNYGLVNPESRIEIYGDDELIAELNLGYTKNGLVYTYNPNAKPLVAIKEEKLNDLFPPVKDMLEEVNDEDEEVVE
ncbi:MAG TPA: DUF4340 domain-containing protein [Caldithrix sp.]|nr:DUF4340 domain-containing protein [Calditrichaceae bacterium]HEM48947.1 DUF4340 domain-containing protein [Caldithrix sp.]HES58793.1 DUF4340 domain-containing protein [Caldithrix sp.]